MGKQKSYVAGVLDRLATLEFFIGEVIPEVLAEEFLRSTLVDQPRPPWATGSLRRSGSVYIGGRKYMSTTDVATLYGVEHLLGPNPIAMYNIEHNPDFNVGYGIDEYDSPNNYSTPARLKLGSIKYKGSGSFGAVRTLRGKVTVMYQAPHAALMHEWTGEFSDDKSGPHYVSSKALMATSNSAFRIQQLSARHVR